MREPREQDVGADVPAGIEIDDRLVRCHRVVVEDGAQRPLARELIVRARPEDAVLEDAGVRGWRAGAAIETCLCCAYGVSQFFGWQWGRYQPPSAAPRFTLFWLATFVIANLIVLTGIDPLNLVEYAVVSSIIVIPFSYLPLLLIANDRKYMGSQVNGRFTNILGIGSYAIVVIAAIAAVPLYLLSSGGQQ